ncbi:hypothetical protein GGF46_003011 [Coemansia sp. RSA 552]|nr:hypothetical protein GGF46_003011 [Coemansia sp. RSA 552]
MAGSDSTAPKRKRPLGLKARSAKKANTTETTSLGAQEVNDFDEANTATVMLRGEASNELDELEGIFDSAREAMAGGEEEEERAMTLLRGSVHESDRLLRIHDAEGEELEPRFYYIYGSALFSLAQIGGDEEEKPEYLRLAHERLTRAQEAMGGGEPFAGQVYSALAKVGLERAFESSDAEAAVTAALANFDQSLAIVEKQQDAQVLAAETLATADLVLSLADSQLLPEEPSQELVTWGEARVRALLGNEESEDAQGMLARALWLQASALMDEEDEIQDQPRYERLLGEAQGLLKKAESGDALLLLGEVQINLGNIQEDEATQEQLYAQAVASFRRAQEIGSLPEQFSQFIDEFQSKD